MSQAPVAVRRIVPASALWLWVGSLVALPLIWVLLDPLSEPLRDLLLPVPGSWAFFKAVQVFGKFETQAAMLLVVYLVYRVNSRRQANSFILMCLLVLVVGAFAVTAVKLVVRRERPAAVADRIQADTAAQEIRTGKRMSFPSGDAESAFALAVVVAAFFARARKPAFAMAALVALSRVYFGCHYFSDVVGGALVGTAVAALVLTMCRSRRINAAPGAGELMDVLPTVARAPRHDDGGFGPLP